MFHAPSHSPGGAATRTAIWAPILTGCATILGAVLRLFHLGSQSLWLDEVSSLRNARAFGQGGLDALAAADQVAPLHSITLWLATIIGSDSEVSLRMPSVIAGVLLIPVMYLLGCRLLRSRWTGAIAALLVAISPYAIWYSQEARMYALLLLCASLAAYLAWPVTERRLRAWELVAITIVTTIGFGMHHYMILLCGAFGLFLLLRGQALQPRAWAWLATQVVAFLLFAGWLYLTRDRLGNVAGTEKPAFALWIPYTFFTYVAGFSFGPATRDIQQAGAGAGRAVLAHAPAVAALGVSCGVLLLAGVRHVWRPERRAVGLWLVTWLIAPILLAVIATRVTNIRYNVRYVIVCYPALILLFSVGIRQAVKLLAARFGKGTPLRPSRLIGAVLTGVAGVALIACLIRSDVQLFANPHYAKEDGRSLARALARLPADTVIVSDNNRVVKVLQYYHGRLPGEKIQVDYRTPTLSAERVWRNFLAIPPERRRDVVLIEYRSWETDPAGLLRRNLMAIARPVGQEGFPGVRITRFQTPATAATR